MESGVELGRSVGFWAVVETRVKGVEMGRSVGWGSSDVEKGGKEEVAVRFRGEAFRGKMGLNGENGREETAWNEPCLGWRRCSIRRSK